MSQNHGALLAIGGMLTAVVLASAGCTIEVEEDVADLQGAIVTMLDESAVAWNRGELDGFMDDYMRSEATTYIGQDGLVAGFEAIRERYAPAFETGADRDSLRFENILSRRLGAVDGVVTARWILHRGDSIVASGPFTLVVRRTSAGWKIIHDHSSSDAQPEVVEE